MTTYTQFEGAIWSATRELGQHEKRAFSQTLERWPLFPSITGISALALSTSCLASPAHCMNSLEWGWVSSFLGRISPICICPSWAGIVAYRHFLWTNRRIFHMRKKNYIMGVTRSPLAFIWVALKVMTWQHCWHDVANVADRNPNFAKFSKSRSVGANV